MAYRIRKFLIGSTILALFVVLVTTLLGYVDSRSAGFHFVATFSLLYLLFTRDEHLKYFEDKLLRRLVYVPLIMGFFACVGGLVAGLVAGKPIIAVVAVLYAIVLNGIRLDYARARRNYIEVGAGYLPQDVWLNPPLDAITDGALIVTDGRMARRARNSVGHSELVVKDSDGKMHVASSYIEKGVVIHTLRAFIAMERKTKENYVVLRLAKPLSAEQSAQLFANTKSVHEDNKQWRDRENERRTRFYNWLPIPAKWRAWLLEHAMSNGYDPLGKWWGGQRKSRYTCMAHNLVLLRSIGVPVGEYGTGAFGLVGELNPLVPIRFLRDPAYELLTTEDQKEFEARKATA